jgi:hypothetical protein
MTDRDELAALIRTEVLAHDGFYDDPGFIDADAWPAIADAILARWRLVPVDEHEHDSMHIHDPCFICGTTMWERGHVD